MALGVAKYFSFSTLAFFNEVTEHKPFACVPNVVLLQCKVTEIYQKGYHLRSNSEFMMP